MSETTTTEVPLQAIGEFALRLPMPNAADVTVEVMSADLGDQVPVVLTGVGDGPNQTLAWTDPFADLALEIEREEAEGVEIFTDPYTVVLPSTLKEGPLGHESPTGDDLAVAREHEEDERGLEKAEQR